MDQPFNLLIDRYLTGELSPAERKDFLDRIAAGAYAAELDGFIDQAMQQGHFDIEENLPLKELIYARIRETAMQETPAPVHRVHFLRRGLLRYAAAILLLVGASITAIYVLSDRNTNKKDPSQTNNDQLATIVPGRDRAMLKLGNGQTILLDSVRGNIVQQDGFTVINSAGKLDYEGKSGEVEYHTLSTPRGGQYKLQLPDGTAVWLNAASSISFPTAFAGKERKVMITGEAYFEVTKNKEKPFVVDVDGKQTVEVLGTHFNINSYTNEDGIRTTLLEGKVKVVNREPVPMKSGSSIVNNESVILQPGEQAQISEIRAPIRVIRDINIDQIMSWKNGLFNFNGADVRTVMRQLERWYDIEVSYEGTVPDISFQGELDRHVSFADMLALLPELGIHYRLEGRKLIVTK